MILASRVVFCVCVVVRWREGGKEGKKEKREEMVTTILHSMREMQVNVKRKQN